MKRIGITGANGFIGQHLRFFLHPLEQSGAVRTVLFDRAVMADPAALAERVTGCDAIVHCAGANRGSDDAVYELNVALAQALTAACRSAGSMPHVVFTSTTHRERDTAYGRSKKEAERIFREWASSVGAPYSTVVMPNVFGEFARPHYNSVVATFCDELARGATSDVRDGAVELVYVRDAVAELYRAVETGQSGEIIVSGAQTEVPALYALLTGFAEAYRSGAIPPLNSSLERHLFATLQSAMFSTLFPLSLVQHTDPRGTLYEMVRDNTPAQVFFSTTLPGQTRGAHYHTRKFERFCVIGGTGEIRIRKLLSDQVSAISVSGERPVVVDMPTYHAHSLVNTGNAPLLAVFWISEHYDEHDPDTYAEAV